MASSPTTSWQMDGETMETVTDFIFLGSKINEFTINNNNTHSQFCLGATVTIPFHNGIWANWTFHRT